MAPNCIRLLLSVLDIFQLKIADIKLRFTPRPKAYCALPSYFNPESTDCCEVYYPATGSLHKTPVE